MHRLTVFGTLDLRTDLDDEVRSVLAQPKRLAVLLYLAVEGRFVQRDLLQVLFWPETDSSRARRALNRTVHFLRQHLGKDALESRGSELGVDPEVVHCDAAEFARREADGDGPGVLAVYGGEMCPGFNAGSGLREFDLWLDGRRAEFRRRARRLAEAEAEGRATAGSMAEAVTWAQRAVAVDPVHEPALRRLMTLFAETGNRGRAMETFAQLRQRLKQTLDVEPDPETVALAEELATRSEPAQGERSRRPSATGDAPPPTSTGPSATPLPPAAARPETAPTRPALRGLVGALGLVLVAAAFWAGARAWSRRDPDPRANSVSLPTATAADRQRVPTASAEAFEAFRRGREAYDQGHFQTAVRAFRTAVEDDPDLAPAYAHLSQAANEAGDYELARWAADQGLARVGQMSRLDSLFTVGWVHQFSVEPRQAMEAYGLLLDTILDPEALAGLADVRFHWGPRLGIPLQETLPLWRQVLTLKPRLSTALTHIIRIEALGADTAAVRASLAQILADEPDTARVLEARILASLTTRDPAALRQVAVAVDSLSGEDRWGALLTMATFAAPSPEKDQLMALAARGATANVPGTEVLRGGVLAAEHGWAAGDSHLLHRMEGFPQRRVQARASLAVALSNQVPADTLAVLLDRLQATDPDAFIGRMDENQDGIYPPRRLFLLSALGAVAGDERAARAARRSLSDYTPPTAVDGARRQEYLSVLDGFLALQSGDPAAALAALGEPHRPPDGLFPDVLDLPDALARWTRAEALARLGRTEDAIRWFRTFPQSSGNDVALAGRARERVEELEGT